ncbi:hypothetical protein I2483_13910 [Sporosarcina sp. E16_3]|uniref:hypothetical protein n=1 Tax=Sporosarcina sp. E16_3 TaxID=2789293 RepID=UPI001A929893|nr:hypothetical protein [Sporosarcina sp. E16_3]MBO0602759.1 hypothetical protein [Sporosarcina sp. E16_3]
MIRRNHNVIQAEMRLYEDALDPIYDIDALLDALAATHGIDRSELYGPITALFEIYVTKHMWDDVADSPQNAELLEIVTNAAQRKGEDVLYNAGFIDGVTQALDILDIKIEGVNVI